MTKMTDGSSFDFICQLKVYWAGPLFNEKDQSWNEEMAEAIREEFDMNVWLPQDVNIDFDDPNWQTKTFNENRRHIEDADIIVACLDGALVDDGTAWEIGYAYALGKHIIGWATDIRSVGIDGKVNLMLEEACHFICDGLRSFGNHLYVLADGQTVGHPNKARRKAMSQE